MVGSNRMRWFLGLTAIFDPKTVDLYMGSFCPKTVDVYNSLYLDPKTVDLYVPLISMCWGWK